MDKKKIGKKIEYFLSWVVLNSCFSFIKRMDEKRMYAFAQSLGSFAYRHASKQRRISMDSLLIAFGDGKPKEELEEIARDSFINIVKSGAELIRAMEDWKFLEDSCRITGKDNLDKALEKGRGVILVSAHFGNFPLMLGNLVTKGYKAGVIMRPMRNAMVEGLFHKKRRKVAVRIISSVPRMECVSRTIKSLRDNEIVLIPMDQNFGTAGVFVDFFGTKAATATGPVVLAQRTGAALVPCFTRRLEDNKTEAVFEPEMPLEEGLDPQDTILRNVQKITSLIEVYIRRYPKEWGWVHRRWKSRPQAKEEVPNGR